MQQASFNQVLSSEEFEKLKLQIGTLKIIAKEILDRHQLPEEPLEASQALIE